MLKVNSQVNVYVNPVENSQFIGVAKLVHFVGCFEVEGVMIERWGVTYLNDPDRIYIMYINGGAA